MLEMWFGCVGVCDGVRASDRRVSAVESSAGSCDDESGTPCGSSWGLDQCRASQQQKASRGLFSRILVLSLVRMREGACGIRVLSGRDGGMCRCCVEGLLEM